MGSQTQEELPQGEYQPKMRGVERVIMSQNQGTDKGGGKKQSAYQSRRSLRHEKSDNTFRASLGERPEPQMRESGP